MRTFAKFAPAVLWAFLLPSIAFAQASLSGVVRDTSGAVLPGVTVEAASPVLIEKVRTAVTDNNGRYQMIDLRPGAYTVTFTWRASTPQAGGVTSAARRRPSSTRSARRLARRDDHRDRRGADRGRLDDVALGRPERRHDRRAAELAQLRQPGPDDSGRGLQRHRRRRVDAAGGRRQRQVHGSRQQDQRVTLNGINTMTLQAGGNIGGQIPDVGSATEVTVDHTAVSAELPTGGVRINFIPRDGGNTFAAATFFTFTNGGLPATTSPTSSKPRD